VGLNVWGVGDGRPSVPPDRGAWGRGGKRTILQKRMLIGGATQCAHSPAKLEKAGGGKVEGRGNTMDGSLKKTKLLTLSQSRGERGECTHPFHRIEVRPAGAFCEQTSMLVGKRKILLHSEGGIPRTRLIGTEYSLTLNLRGKYYILRKRRAHSKKAV